MVGVCVVFGREGRGGGKGKKRGVLYYPERLTVVTGMGCVRLLLLLLRFFVRGSGSRDGYLAGWGDTIRYVRKEGRFSIFLSPPIGM